MPTKVLIIDLGSKFNAFGGQARMAAVLNKKLGDAFKTYYLGYETAYSKGMKNPIFIERSKRMGLSIRRSRLSEMWLPRLAYNLFVVSRMSDLEKESIFRKVREISPDVIISNSIQDINLLSFLRKRGLKFKAIYIDHGSVSTGINSYFSKEGIPLTVGTGLDSLSVAGKKGKFFNFYDINVALNHDQLGRMCDFTDKVALIQNGLDIKVEKNPKKISALREKYAIKPGDFVILYIGRMFDRQKNVSTLIRAFKGALGDNLRLLLVGDGPSLQNYRKLAEGDKRIIFGGGAKDDDVSTTYDISSLFVLPSFWEGFSLTILEAAAHSLPMILSSNAYVDDLKGEGLGRIASFDPHNVEELRRKIIALYESKELRAAGARASAKIHARFTEDLMIEKYRKMISKLA